MKVYGINDNTNFGALNDVRCVGKFRTHVLKADEILNSVYANTKFQEFCKRWDVDLVLNTRNYSYSGISSDLMLFYRKAKNYKSEFFKKLVRNFTSSKLISISGYAHDFDDSVKELNKYIVQRGALSARIDQANMAADKKAGRKH